MKRKESTIDESRDEKLPKTQTTELPQELWIEIFQFYPRIKTFQTIRILNKQNYNIQWKHFLADIQFHLFLPGENRGEEWIHAYDSGKSTSSSVGLYWIQSFSQYLERFKRFDFTFVTRLSVHLNRPMHVYERESPTFLEEAISGLTVIENLDLSEIPIDDNILTKLLEKSHSIREIHLCLKSIKDEKSLQLLNGIPRLHLSHGDWVDDKAMENIDWRNITCLSLVSFPRITGSCLSKLCKIQEIDLPYRYGSQVMDDETCQYLKGASTVTFKDAKLISTKGLRYFADTVRNLTLEVAHQITDEDLFLFKNVESLRLTHTWKHMTGKGFVSLKKLKRLEIAHLLHFNTDFLQYVTKELEHLSLTIVSEESLVYLKDFHNLSSLCLSGKFKDDAMQYMPPTIKYLDISRCDHMTGKYLYMIKGIRTLTISDKDNDNRNTETLLLNISRHHVNSLTYLIIRDCKWFHERYLKFLRGIPWIDLSGSIYIDFDSKSAKKLMALDDAEVIFFDKNRRKDLELLYHWEVFGKFVKSGIEIQVFPDQFKPQWHLFDD